MPSPPTCQFENRSLGRTPSVKVKATSPYFECLRASHPGAMDLKSSQSFAVISAGEASMSLIMSVLQEQM